MTRGDTLLHEAERFVSSICGEGKVTIQLFDETPQKQAHLSKILHVNLADAIPLLTSMNEQGAGVFFMVNEGDGKGRKARNVVRVRSLFSDNDKSIAGDLPDSPLPPHAIVESSPGKFHRYFKVSDVTLEQFPTLQLALAKHFDSDRSIKDPSRVMRLPGWYHNKGRPVLCRLVSLYDGPAYTADEIAEAFGAGLVENSSAPVSSKVVPVLTEQIVEGARNDTLFNLARGLVNKGIPHPEVASRIQKVNALRCYPPLCATEVDELVTNAVSHGVKGNLHLPLAVFDSPEYRALPHAAKTVLAVAYRRFNGSNNGNIALPFSEFSVEFSRPQSFYKARKQAESSGLLRRVRKRSYCNRGGLEPDLFEVTL